MLVESTTSSALVSKYVRILSIMNRVRSRGRNFMRYVVGDGPAALFWRAMVCWSLDRVGLAVFSLVGLVGCGDDAPALSDLVLTDGNSTQSEESFALDEANSQGIDGGSPTTSSGIDSGGTGDVPVTTGSSESTTANDPTRDENGQTAEAGSTEAAATEVGSTTGDAVEAGTATGLVEAGTTTGLVEAGTTGDPSGEGGPTTSSTESSDDGSACGGFDEDADGICDADDLCDNNLGTHCLEFGGEEGILLESLLSNETGAFEPLLGSRLRIGLTLDGVSLEESPNSFLPCETIASTTFARLLLADVVELRVLADNESAQEQLETVILVSFDGELASRMAWSGELDTPSRFETVFFPRLDPDFAFILDSDVFTPGCNFLNVDEPMIGSEVVLRMYRGSAQGDDTVATDRLGGRNGTFVLRPHDE